MIVGSLILPIFVFKNKYCYLSQDCIVREVSVCVLLGRVAFPSNSWDVQIVGPIAPLACESESLGGMYQSLLLQVFSYFESPGIYSLLLLPFEKRQYLYQLCIIELTFFFFFFGTWSHSRSYYWLITLFLTC